MCLVQAFHESRGRGTLVGMPYPPAPYIRRPPTPDRSSAGGSFGPGGQQGPGERGQRCTRDAAFWHDGPRRMDEGARLHSRKGLGAGWDQTKLPTSPCLPKGVGETCGEMQSWCGNRKRVRTPWFDPLAAAYCGPSALLSLIPPILSRAWPSSVWPDVYDAESQIYNLKKMRCISDPTFLALRLKKELIYDSNVHIMV